MIIDVAEIEMMMWLKWGYGVIGLNLQKRECEMVVSIHNSHSDAQIIILNKLRTQLIT